MRKILIIFSILLLTGCSAEYNLTYEDDMFTETISVKLLENEKLFNEKKEELINKKIFSYSDESSQLYYNKEYKTVDNFFVMDYNYIYDFNKFRKARIFSECFEKASITSDDNNYYILTSGQFKCLNFNEEELDEVKIVFTTKNKIISNNADEVNKNKYIWFIDSNNLDKNIKITFSKKELNKDNTNIYIILGILLGILFIGLPGYLYIKRKRAK